MKKLVWFVLLVAVISLAAGCGQKSETVSITGPGGQKTSMTVK